MKTQKPDYINLTNLVGRLREGRFVIPDFQREFEWKPWDIRELVRSIFLDYYIGSLLLWKGKPENFSALACEVLYGHNSDQVNQEHIVLDGQQRLTALYYVFFAPDTPLPNRSSRFFFFIRVDKFMAEVYDEAFEYDWTRRGENLNDNSEAQFESHMFPLSVIGGSYWDLGNWVQNYQKHWADKKQKAENWGDNSAMNHADQCVQNAIRFGEHLKSITDEYHIAYIELDRDLAIDKVCDIFTQINSRGRRLDIFDLINALLKPKDLQLKLLWREAEPKLDFVKTERLNVYLLQVMSILLQAYCSPKYLYYLLPEQARQVRAADGSLKKTVLVRDVAEFKGHWDNAVAAIESAIKLLRHPHEFGAISQEYLPYVSIIPAFAALNATLCDISDLHKLSARRKLHLWYWASVFTHRYSGAVESTSARDYLDVKNWFKDDAAEPSLIDEFRSRVNTLDLRREIKRGSSVYNGIFNLLILKGARDWVTGSACQPDDLDDHHIVPRSWGNSEKDLGENIHSILNRTPLTTDTNRNFIRDRLPNEYIPELIAKNGEDIVRQTMDSHYVSKKAMEILLRNPFKPSDFVEFLNAREDTIRNAIKNLLN